MLKNSKDILFFDTETTGILKDQKGKVISNWDLIQLAYRKYQKDKKIDENYFFNTDTRIQVFSMAVHGIYKKLLFEKSGWKYLDNDIKNKFSKDFSDSIIIAHNIKFDTDVLEKSWISFSSIMIDTLKISKIMHSEWVLKSESWEEPEYFTLQYLRYFFEIYEILDEKWELQKVNAHDAFWDVVVLEQIFYKMFFIIKELLNLSDDEILDKMIEMTKKQFICMKTIKIWKYRWKTFEEILNIDKSYLKWILKSDFTEDIKYTCRVILWEIEDSKFFS